MDVKWERDRNMMREWEGKGIELNNGKEEERKEYEKGEREREEE